MNILHISDLHFGMNQNNNEIMLEEKMEEVLGKLGSDFFPEVLLITGDFTNSGSPNEFANVKNMLDNFKNYDSLKQIQYYVFVPGNHDFTWKENGTDLNEEQRKVNYKNFAGATVKKSFKLNNKKDLQKKLDEYMIQHYIGNIADSNKYFLLIGMNSMLIDSQKRAGQGYFSKPQLNVIKQLIQYYEKDKELVVMVAFHHHIIPISYVERDTLENSDKFSLTLDARRVIDFLLENNIRFAVHGHQHQPSIVTWKDEVKNAKKELHIISNGSISAVREQLGDFMKNSFMLYHIEKDELTIRHFSNSEEDVDTFVENKKFECTFELIKKESKCNVSVNGVEPVGLELKEYNINEDTSNLYYLYLNVIDCYESTVAIDNFTIDYNSKNNNKIVICGLHHLYGKFDILVKYRDDAATDLYYKKLIQYLKERKCIVGNASKYFMNVSYEKVYYKGKEKIPFLKSTEAYLNSTWNMATLRVETGKKLSPTAFLKELGTKISDFNQMYNTKMEDIIRNYVVGQDQSIIFELFISCYQFPMLSRFTNLIEEIIREYAVDKSTHIIYYYDEREL